MKCGLCGMAMDPLDVAIAPLGEARICGDCRTTQAAMKAAAGRAAASQAIADRLALVAAAKDVLVTTTAGVEGFRIAAYLGVESVEYIVGTGPFTEAIADVREFRDTPFQRKLQAAKKWALDLLKLRAAEAGANAVVGVDMDYAEFSGDRVALIVNGTLVQLVGEARG